MNGSDHMPNLDSCDLRRRETWASQKRTTHGGAARGRVTPEYTCWHGLRKRCLNPSHKLYAYYGGRGITVCEEWRDDFAAFLRDMGRRPSPKHSLDRIDNDGPYSPHNCRWATRKQQSRNTRKALRITLNGTTMPLADACELVGLPYKTVWLRLLTGWSEERALSRGPRYSACRRGHPYMDGSFWVRRNGSRVCRACDRLRQQAWRDGVRLSRKTEAA